MPGSKKGESEGRPGHEFGSITVVQTEGDEGLSYRSGHENEKLRINVTGWGRTFTSN